MIHHHPQGTLLHMKIIDLIVLVGCIYLVMSLLELKEAIIQLTDIVEEWTRLMRPDESF